MIRKLFICILFLVIGALAQANLNLSSTLAAKGGKSLGESELEARLQALEGYVQELSQYVTIVEGPINGMPGPHIIVTGANLHVRSGEGVTDGSPTGLGNLVIGYNEEPPVLLAFDRHGTHNLIVGPKHRYLSFGGFLAGIRNTTSANYASVCGGRENTASGNRASVSGGRENMASGIEASVSGGKNNTASGFRSSVSGGESNTASNISDSVSGGLLNTASGVASSVSGGKSNTASGFKASVSGGNTRTAAGENNWAAGSLSEPN